MKICGQGKKYIIGTAVVLLLTILVWYSKRDAGIITKDGSLVRQEKGSGDYEAILILEVDETEQTEIVFVVPEQYLTQVEEKVLLEAAIEEIEAGFLKENDSLENVQGEVSIQTSYQEGLVTAEWTFSNARIVAENGMINEEAMSEQWEEVTASVCLTCEDSNLVYEFGFKVCKREKSEKEKFYESLYQTLNENSREEGVGYVHLPNVLEGHTLEWKDGESNLPLQVFLLGMVVVLLLPALEKEREKEVKEQRKKQLQLEYPDMVNKLALLLGAGMTLQGAWKQITQKYCEEKERNQNGRGIVYEEMLITQREIESGKGETRAYEAFGERCELQKYRKLSGFLVQNLKKGNKQLCNLLEQEAAEAFDERKKQAQQLGEEAGTKLLFPMLLMLGIVIVIIMIPAVISFQLGVN